MFREHYTNFLKIQRIVVSAGHGAGDTGATNGPHTEAAQATIMAERIAADLSSMGADVSLVPTDLGLRDSIRWVNETFNPREILAIEIHRDSSDNKIGDPSTRCGVYHGIGSQSRILATRIVGSLKDCGASPSSWARPDRDSRHGSLAWIRQVKGLSYIFELGFMQGDNSPSHILKLAGFASKAIAMQLK